MDVPWLQSGVIWNYSIFFSHEYINSALFWLTRKNRHPWEILYTYRCISLCMNTKCVGVIGTWVLLVYDFLLDWVKRMYYFVYEFVLDWVKRVLYFVYDFVMDGWIKSHHGNTLSKYVSNFLSDPPWEGSAAPSWSVVSSCPLPKADPNG